MKTDILLSRLDGVKKGYTPNTWLARCPAHPDKTPSLAIREEDDRVLIHCFAGCSPFEIVSAVSMDLSDLFPESRESHKPLKRRYMPQDVITCLAGETFFVTLCSEALAKGEKLAEVDVDRLTVAHRRFQNAARAAGL
jgi:hypothetical protein